MTAVDIGMPRTGGPEHSDLAEALDHRDGVPLSRARSASTAARVRRTPPTPRTTARCPSASSCRAPSTTPWRASRCAATTRRRCCPAAAAPAWPGRHERRRGHRLDQVLPPAGVASTRSARTLRRRARHRARRAEPQLAPHGLMFGPEAVDPPQLHARRDDRQQLLRSHRPGATARPSTTCAASRCSPTTAPGCGSGRPPTRSTRGSSRPGGRRAEIYRALRELRDEHLALIRTRYPDIPRRVSGYNLDSLLPENGFDLARALVGSEGTLVTVLHAELDLVPVPAAQAMVVLGYPDIATAADAVPHVLRHDPWQLEGMDQVPGPAGGVRRTWPATRSPSCPTAAAG